MQLTLKNTIVSIDRNFLPVRTSPTIQLEELEVTEDNSYYSLKMVDPDFYDYSNKNRLFILNKNTTNEFEAEFSIKSEDNGFTLEATFSSPD